MNAQLQPVFDTAGSVLSLIDEQSNTTAGIAGEHFEGDSRFKILEKNISNPQNYTPNASFPGTISINRLCLDAFKESRKNIGALTL